VVNAAIANGLAALAPILAQAQDERHFQIEKLDPPTRAKVLAALTALLILMIGLMVLAWMGARWARAYGRRTPLSFERRQKEVLDPDDWAAKPVRPADPDEDREAPG
jgi:hypothetical protein